MCIRIVKKNHNFFKSILDSKTKLKKNFLVMILMVLQYFIYKQNIKYLDMQLYTERRQGTGKFLKEN